MYSSKVLGVTIFHNLKCGSRVNSTCVKASSRLPFLFLKILKRCSLSTDDLSYSYVSTVGSVAEYACPAWHISLTKEHCCQIEHIQKREIKINYF